MNWDPFQREVLAELGHVVYRVDSLRTEAMGSDPTTVGPSNVSVASRDAAMLDRLARAAGVRALDLPAELRAPAALSRLRGDGPAKRALWPALRALRARPR